MPLYMRQITEVIAVKKRILKISAIALLTLAILVGAFAMYVGNYYSAELDDIGVFESMNNVDFTTEDDGTMVFGNKDADVGLIFYPGGKVEYTAYQPLMAALAERGITCVLLKMPFNLAVFDVNAAKGIREKYPDIDVWYIGGHSLGGSMAASYLKKHADNYEGLILLGSYSATDISNTSLKVISAYGSEDKILNKEKYDKNKKNLPDDFYEYEIVGGCHSYFGMYGLQDGDGVPTIENDEQIILVADYISEKISAAN